LLAHEEDTTRVPSPGVREVVLPTAHEAAPPVAGKDLDGRAGAAPVELDEESTAITIEDFKRAAGSFITGVTVVTTRAPDGRLMGFTANSFTSVSLDPPLVLICLHRNAPSLRAFQVGCGYAINVLNADQEWISRHFARPADDKFASVPYWIGATGAPLIEGCIAHIDCSLEVAYDGGDHVILLGRVQSVATDDGSPLIFHRSRYLRAV
jgi:flavin reductase (DIM6/NTAB) family NADH-FMN oxidoreductase RutF